jgi:hypothetical protein
VEGERRNVVTGKRQNNKIRTTSDLCDLKRTFVYFLL